MIFLEVTKPQHRKLIIPLTIIFILRKFDKYFTQ